MSTTTQTVPPRLINAILRGRCVAFVGAGFSKPAVPSWRDLLGELGGELGHEVRIPDGASALEYELVGAALREKAGSPQVFERLVQKVLAAHASGPNHDEVCARRARLLHIPFKAILTTNFDQYLPVPTVQETPQQIYRRVLREDRGQWWDLPEGASDPRGQVPIIKLHGDANGCADRDGLVLGRGDYRRRLYGEHGYTSFIRAAFAEYTVLFIGVSFTDAYLNELRSETLQLLGATPDQPWGFAIQLDPRVAELAPLFRDHEGIELLPATTPFEVDGWLTALEAATSLTGRLTALLGGKRIVWIDERRDNNTRGHALFTACGATVRALTSERELTPDDATADVLITQYGHVPDGDSRAARVLDIVRGWRERPPVIVFAAHNAPTRENRSACLRRGAWEYTTAWSELYRLIELLFDRTPGLPSAAQDR